MTPSWSSGVFVWWYQSELCLNDTVVNDEGGPIRADSRAVINLKPNVIVNSGTGTSSNPYIIK